MNRYDIEKVVGEGSYGKALLCKRKSDYKRCIIKQISVSKMRPKEVKQTEQESSLLSKFNHPNIVSFWESFTTPTHLFIVMEYADGGDLDRYVKNQKGRLIPEQIVLNLFVQISLALKHVHDRKILHRDLKCQNIFLTSKGICKLGDFGVSRILQGTMEMASTQIGTPYYMSPEIMEGKVYNSKTDVWSLAIIFYELLALRVPFEGQNMRQLCFNIVNAKPNPPSSTYSKELHELLYQMLQKNPRQRPGINTILAKDIIRRRIQGLLDEKVMESEFNHTVLHGVNIMDRNYKPDNVALSGANPPPPSNNIIRSPSPSNNPVLNSNPNPNQAPSNHVNNYNNNNNVNNYNNNIVPKPIVLSSPPLQPVLPPKQDQKQRIDVISEILAEKKKQQLQDQRKAREAVIILEERRKADELKRQQQQKQQQQQLLEQQQQQQRIKLEKERLEKVRLEKERLEKERLEKERFEKARFEKARLEREKYEKDKAEALEILKERERQRLEKAKALEEERRLALEKIKLQQMQQQQQQQQQQLQQQQQQQQKAIIGSAAEFRGPVPLPAPRVLDPSRIDKARPPPTPLQQQQPPSKPSSNANLAARPLVAGGGIARGGGGIANPTAARIEKGNEIKLSNASYLKPRKIDVQRVDQRQEELRVRQMLKLQREKEERDKLEEAERDLNHQMEGDEYDIDLTDGLIDVRKRPQMIKGDVSNCNLVDNNAGNITPQLPKNDWIHNMKMKMGQIDKQVKLIDIKSPASKSSDANSDEDFSGSDESNEESAIVGSNDAKMAIKVVTPNAAQQNIKNPDNIANSNNDSNDNNREVVSPRQIDLKGLESKMDVLKRQMDVLKSFRQGGVPGAANVASNRAAIPAANLINNPRINDDNSNSHGIASPKPSSAIEKSRVASKPLSSLRRDGKVPASNAEVVSSKAPSGKSNAAKKGAIGDKARQSTSKQKEKAKLEKDREKDREKLENRKPIDAKELRAMRDLERENLRKLMREKRKEVNNDKVEVDIKYNNFLVGGIVSESESEGEGEGVNKVKVEEGNSSLDSDPNSLSSTSASAVSIEGKSSENENDFLDRSSTSSKLLNEGNGVGSGDHDDDGEEEYGDNISIDEFSESSHSIGSHSGDSLSNKFTYNNVNSLNNDTIQYDDNYFDAGSNGKVMGGAISEYSVLFQQMQEILKLPNAKNNRNLDVSTMIFMSDTAKAAPSGSFNEENCESSDDDVFEEEGSDVLSTGDGLDYLSRLHLYEIDLEKQRAAVADGDDNVSDKRHEGDFDFYVIRGDSFYIGETGEDTAAEDPSGKIAIQVLPPSTSNIDANSSTIDPFKDLSFDINAEDQTMKNVSTSYADVADDNDSGNDALSEDDQSWNDNEGVDINSEDTVAIRRFLQRKLGEDVVESAVELLREVDKIIPGGVDVEECETAEDAFFERLESIVGLRGMEYLDLLYKLVINM